MNRFLLFSLLALTGVLTGCTTQDQLDQQTEDINQYATEVVQKENRPITKLRVLSVSVSMHCVGYNEHDHAVKIGQGAEPHIERDHRIQDFDDGRTLVLNGLKEIDDSACPQPEDDMRNTSSEVMEIGEELKVESIKYIKTIYQKDRPVASSVKRCRFCTEYDTKEPGFRPEDPVQGLYATCFEIEDAMQVIGR